MMFVDNNFFNNENTKRLGFGVFGAVIFHGLVLIWLSLPNTQTTIATDILSGPTNVSIRFITPIKKEAKLISVAKKEPIKKKSVIKKAAKPITKKPIPETFNKIEPAAAPPQIREAVSEPKQYEPVKHTKPKTIPVVSGANLKGRRIQPEYPKRALRMKQEGVVWLRVLISETGTRKKLKLHKPSQYALLNQAAMKAVKKWTFEPNIVNGSAVQSWVEIPIEFKIQ